MIKLKNKWPNIPFVNVFDGDFASGTKVNDVVKWILSNCADDSGIIRFKERKSSDEPEYAVYGGGRIDKVYLEDIQEQYGDRDVYDIQAIKWGPDQNLDFVITACRP